MIDISVVIIYDYTIMKFKIRILPLLLTGAFSLIYIFVAVRPLSKELQFEPEWTVSVSQTPSSSENKNLIPFKSGQVLGYFTEDGKIRMSCTFPLKASISDSYYAPYGLSDSSIPFYTPDGIQAGTIPECGFPFIDDDRLYLFLPGGNSFSRYSAEGKKLWTYEGFVPVTAFASSKSGTAAGFADGKILTFTPDGSLSQEFIPGGSKYSVIFGVDISPDGTYVACLSGLEKQRIVLAHIEKNHTVITFFKYLEHDQRSQALVQFSKDGKWLYYAHTGGLGIVNCASGKNHELALDGWISSLSETEIPGTFIVLTRNKKLYTVYVVENEVSLSGKFSFEANTAFAETRGSSLFVGRDSKISKIELSKK